jgi:hypothetical protein
MKKGHYWYYEYYMKVFDINKDLKMENIQDKGKKLSPTQKDFVKMGFLKSI